MRIMEWRENTIRPTGGRVHSPADPRAGGRNLRPGTRGGDLRAAGVGGAAGEEGRALGLDAVGDDPAVSEAGTEGAEEEARSEARSRGGTARAAAENHAPGGAPAAGLLSGVRLSKKLKRLLRDAVRLGRCDDLADERFASRRARLDRRLADLFDAPTENRNVNRLQKRLRRYQDALFTFLDHPGVPSDNNHAEREIRPAVIMRKNSLCNRSDSGANVQAILMSVYRTLKLRGRDPLDTIVAALRDYVRTGTLPPLPN